MSNRLARALTLTTAIGAATLFVSWPATNASAEASASAKAAMKGHPEKQHVAAVVPKSSKAMPPPKEEKAPKATNETLSWVPGDYFWNGGDWSWADGYWLTRPWPEAVWIPGHWATRWWGWSWVPGYWF